MSFNPPLDAVRLYFAANVLETAAGLFKRIAEDERFNVSQRMGILPEGEADRLDTAAQYVWWLAAEFRRSGIKLVATDEIEAGRLSGEPAVPSTPAVFAALMHQPNPPLLPREPITVATSHLRMVLVRERLEEVCSVLASGQGRSISAALGDVRALITWCGGTCEEQ